MKHRKRTRRPSRAVREACARFGITAREADARPGGATPARLEALAESLDRTLGPGGVAFVTGPSGSGKTRLMRTLARRLRNQRGACIKVGAPADPRARVLDLIVSTARPRKHGWHPSGASPARRGGTGPVRTESRVPSGQRTRATHEAHAGMRLLAGAGLADAWVMLSRARRLSAGEAWRLALARAMGKAERTQHAAGTSAVAEPSTRHARTLLIDEFASVLDRHTASVLARLVRRWARASGVRVICATAHDDVLEPLGPDAIVVFDGEGEAQIVARPGEE